MMKLGVFFVLFFSSVFGMSCGNTLQNGNVSVSCTYVSANSDGTQVFAINIANNVPGVPFPNSAAARISDVHSFAFVNATSAGPIQRAHLSYANINGGAAFTRTFTVPASMVGDGKCMFIGFAYIQNNAESYFYGSLELDPSNLPPTKKDEVPVAEDVNAVHDLSARDTCGQWSFTGPTSFSATIGTSTSNPYYFKSGTSGVNNANVTCVQIGGNSVTISYAPAGPNFGAWAANTQKQGNIVFSPASTGSFNIQCTIAYYGAVCGSNTFSATIPLGVTGKRSLEAPVLQSASLSTNYGVVIASAGLAVGAVAVVAAVVTIRRRNTVTLV